MRTTGGAFAIRANVVVFVCASIAVVCGAGGGLVYLVAAKFRVVVGADFLTPYGLFALILQQVRHLAAVELGFGF